MLLAKEARTIVLVPRPSRIGGQSKPEGMQETWGLKNGMAEAGTI